MKHQLEISTSITISESYAQYQQDRERLHVIELTAIEGTAIQKDALVGLHHTRGLVAQAAISLYNDATSTAEFLEHVENELLLSPNFHEEGYRMGIDNALLGAYLIPPSLLCDDIPSPVEAIYATAKNLAIADRFKASAEDESNGVLLTGTNAWGGFFAVRGGIPDQLQDEGIPQLPYGEISDIDLVVTADSVEELGRCVERFIRDGLISQSELDRFMLFKQLYAIGEAEIFSLRSHYNRVEQSIHFISEEVITQVCSMTPARIHKVSADLAYGIVRDFRPNIPGNIKKHGAYPLSDLLGLEEVSFSPLMRKITSETGKFMGYISETTVGGPAAVDGEETYYMGVLSFFMAIDPVILFDKTGKLGNNSKELQKGIAAILQGAKPQVIPRQERMPEHALARIEHMLQYGDASS